ncbi:MAG TPA: type I glyceraldehyde-3-phosphate dehydrogenase [Bdellovibrionota bacterium]|nr:type I glyceraldehyde-3-phosphate dehydrogenase [Bdellovibrionota bacterium]
MRIAINGFGRIGRIVARQYFLNPQFRKDLEIVAINDITPQDNFDYFFKYDTAHGTLPFDVKKDGSNLVVDGKKIALSSERNVAKLPWKDLGVDVVFECTGVFKGKEDAIAHVTEAGAKKVIISAPAKGVDLTVVMGVNHTQLKSEHTVLSNASCTTNCLAPIVSTLHKAFGIKHGLMTTIHSYTSDQRILDNVHSDPRRGRTAACNMIPTTTGAAKTVGEVIPELKGKLDGFSMRVPTPNVSFTDFVAEVSKNVTAEEVNAALKKAAENELKGIMGISGEPLVSSDFMSNPHSSIVDLALTNVMQGTMVKVGSWYDNEAGFSNRMLDLATYLKKFF